LASCDRGAHLSGTDTGNPMIVAKLADSTGTPLVGARVYLYKKNAAGVPELVDSLLSDSKGRVTTQVADNSQYGLEAYWKDSLGAYVQVTPTCDSTEQNVLASRLVTFPVQASTTIGSALFSETGRVIAAGKTMRIPAGLWSIHYVVFGDSASDTLPTLSVQVDAAREVPEALEGLTTAARNLDSLGIVANGYTAFSQYAAIASSITRSKIQLACDMAGFSEIKLCDSGTDCRIWQWHSNWISLDSTMTQPLLVGAVTGGGRNLCVFFPDATLDSSVVNVLSFVEVRKGL